MRLDKLLSHMGYGSRKTVKEYIRKGFVLVNGEIVKSDDFKVEEFDDIILADQKVDYIDKVYYMLNKPAGYVSATTDRSFPTVLNFFDNIRGLFPVGRLDIDTVGLLLISNDGALAHKLLSPKNHVDKDYFVTFEGQLTKEMIERLENGITLDDGYVTKPAVVSNVIDNTCILTIREGKYHQVKRMFIDVGSKVLYLKRVKFGTLELDLNLKEGEFRKLTDSEIESLRGL